MNSIEQRAGASAYPPGWLVGQLPVGMRDDDLLVRFTTIFERLGSTLREGADGVERVVDPTVTTPGMLAMLGNWLGYDVLDPELPIAHQRQIIRALGHALAWRGTAAGLQLLLEAITDGPVRIDEPGRVIGDDGPTAMHGTVAVQVHSTGHLRYHELEALIRDEVPAHLHVTLTVASRPELDPPARPETRPESA